jgi:hypothetical protein
VGALWLCVAVMESMAQPSVGGIVYGPKGAFNISAPKGWVLDPSAGAAQGLPCVLYPKGMTWDAADPIMYAKIASTDYEDYEKFAAEAVADMKEKRPGIKPKRVDAGKTKGGQLYFINDYPATKAYPRHERVAYVQLPKAVAYIVFSADEEANFRKHQDALSEAVKSLLSLNVDYPGKPKEID